MHESNGVPSEKTALEDVGRHEHLCLVYEGEAELLNPVIAFIQKGVKSGERCVYLDAGEEVLGRVLKSAVVAAQKNGSSALQSLSKEQSWLKGRGQFDAETVLTLLSQIYSAAVGDGFQGIRIICDMGWASREDDYGDKLVELEAALTIFAIQQEVTLLCLYRRSKLTPDLILTGAKEHSHLILSGKLCRNPLHLTAEPHQRADRPAAELEAFLSAVKDVSGADEAQKLIRQELEQAYAALARKIYENWQGEDTLRVSEQQLIEREASITEHKRRFQTILQHLPVMLAGFDGENRLSACNHEFERVSGFKVEEVIGKRMLELFDGEDLAEETVVDDGNYRGREWRIRCKDGSHRSVSWSNISKYVPMPGWHNWIMGVDVTQRVHAEEGLRSVSDQLSRCAGDLEALGYAISHDLSGKLSQVSSHCRAIQDLYGASLPTSCRELVQGIQEASLEMAGRVAALFRFTSLASREISAEEVDLSAMAVEIASQLRCRSGETRRVTFKIEDGVVARGDQKLLRLALEQLLENAWNYSRGEENPVIGFGMTQIEGRRSYFVSDNGPRASRDMGVTGGECSPSAGSVYGIGLATVQRIVALHHGRLWISDEAGKGGTLYFTV